MPSLEPVPNPAGCCSPDKPTTRKRKSSDLLTASGAPLIQHSSNSQPRGQTLQEASPSAAVESSTKRSKKSSSASRHRENQAGSGSSQDSSPDKHHKTPPSDKHSSPSSSSSNNSRSRKKKATLSKLASFSGEGNSMGNCIGNKPQQSNPAVSHADHQVVETLTHSPKRTSHSPPASSNEQVTPGAPEESATQETPASKQSPAGKHGSRRRLSLIHADPITHQSEDGPRGSAQILQRRAGDHRPSLENVLSKDGEGTRVSIMGAAAHTHQKNFEDKNETCKGNVGGDTLTTMGIGHACRKGLKPESPNQDDFFIIRIDDIGLYGVFDGHGPFGHDISNFVQQNLPRMIYNHPDFYTDPKSTLKAAFAKVQEDIEKACEKRDFDAALSGCTATVIIHDIEKNLLYVAHVGDSRAVLARRVNDTQFEAVDLTQDHKPTMEEERARIEAKGGEVKRLEGDIPYRVFLKDKMYPGLAMSRALGDLVAGQAGVSAEPDITLWELQKDRDAFIVLCSDGVWEFITSQESVDLVSKHGRRSVQFAADTLARESWNKWIVEEGDVVDDITVEIIYLF